MRQEMLGTILLVGASLIVGASILLDSSFAKVLNGTGGLAWFVAAAMLSIAAFRSSRSPRQWFAAVFLAMIVAFVVRPSDLLLAILGFGFAGLAIVWLAPLHNVLWAKLIVGMYLPFHVGAAIGKSVVRSLAGIETSMRTDPPPTAALVPLVMVVAAMVGGVLARHLATIQQSQR